MVVPPVEQVRVVKKASEDASALVRAVCTPEWGLGAEVMKSTGRTSVLAGEALGRRVVVKCVAIDGVAKRVARLAGRSRLRRELHMWNDLVRFDAPVPRFGALASGRGASGGLVEALIMDRVEGETVLSHLASGSMRFAQERALLDVVAALTGKLVYPLPMFNADHKASNLMAQRDGGRWRITLIDLAGFRWSTAGPDHKAEAERMLATLAIECLGVGVLPRRAALMRALRTYCESSEKKTHKDARALWRAIERRIAAHGDPTPKDDPLL